jgi:hypothetical protein
MRHIVLKADFGASYTAGTAMQFFSFFLSFLLKMMSFSDYQLIASECQSGF